MRRVPSACDVPARIPGEARTQFSHDLGHIGAGQDTAALTRVATENAATQQRNQMLQGLFGQVSGGGLTDIFKTTPPASSASANPLDFSNNNLFGPAGAPSANLKFGLKK